ncbi:DMT family transporter [Magnetospira sp. QH-2]|uniref:DMT family transporter n=1 Tax=Magnetospira sp. (strain QH-2) TaxID=1288970 RepID=UPI0003E813B5|nr:DMT family transporter [Magnetospira sp. QH-2]CCQ74166.1 Conserved membrane protein of unknown function [Magnetospira sp. QH-2]
MTLPAFTPAQKPATAVIRGVLWMSLAACLLGLVSLLAREAARFLPPFEVAFFRNLAQLLLMLPWLILVGWRAVKTQRPWAHVRRSLFGIAAMLTWFSVVTMMPIAEATALSFSAPLFTTAGAALFFRETVGFRRWAATLVGFAGVLIILRPGFHDIETAQLLALMAAVFIAGAMLSNKSLARTESPNAMVLWMGLFMTMFSFPPAVMVWVWPEATIAWFWIGGLGVVATGAHLAINRAFASADASLVAPFGFVQIPFIALVGFWAYGEMPDLWTWIGAGIIVASGVYIGQREARRAQTLAVPSG